MNDLISKSEYGKAIGLKIEMMRTKIDNCRNHVFAQSVMNHWESEIKGLYDALIILDDVSTVDAVEVVRCGECKHFDSNWSYCGSDVHYCKKHKRAKRESEFCSDGER